MSLLDGKVVAVDRDTGRQLWTFDSGPPLLSVSGTAEDRQENEGADSTARSSVQSVIPSVHGKLYGYRQQGPFTRGLEVLTAIQLADTCGLVVKSLVCMMSVCMVPCGNRSMEFKRANMTCHLCATRVQGHALTVSGMLHKSSGC